MAHSIVLLSTAHVGVAQHSYSFPTCVPGARIPRHSAEWVRGPKTCTIRPTDGQLPGSRKMKTKKIGENIHGHINA